MMKKLWWKRSTGATPVMFLYLKRQLLLFWFIRYNIPSSNEGILCWNAFDSFFQDDPIREICLMRIFLYSLLILYESSETHGELFFMSRRKHIRKLENRLKAFNSLFYIDTKKNDQRLKDIRKKESLKIKRYRRKKKMIRD